jgi:hypothetical protein
MTRVRTVCQIALLITALTWPALAQTQAIKTPQKTEVPAVQVLPLSAEATQVADDIEVTVLIEKLRSERAAGSPMSVQTILIRQQITERVLAASLDLDSVNAVIDSEIEQIRSIRSQLQSQRDKAQNIINIASLVTGGALGVVNTALQFSSSTANLGNGIGVGGGAASVVLSIIGMRKQGGRLPLGDSPRMLARFFGRQPPGPEVIPSVYPKGVWTYLNSVSPGDAGKVTRRDQLIAKWQKEGKVGPDNSIKSQRKVEALSGTSSQTVKLGISELDDRVAMLMDVRARVSLMKRQLSEIMRSVSDTD